jgi:hypothetical protein
MSDLEDLEEIEALFAFEHAKDRRARNKMIQPDNRAYARRVDVRQDKSVQRRHAPVTLAGPRS